LLFYIYNAYVFTKTYVDHLLESSHRYYYNKWPNIGFVEEITKIESIKVNFTGLIWCPGNLKEAYLNYHLTEN